MNGCRLQERPRFITIQIAKGRKSPLPAQIASVRCKWSRRRAVVNRQFSTDAQPTRPELTSSVKKNRPDHIGGKMSENGKNPKREMQILRNAGTLRAPPDVPKMKFAFTPFKLRKTAGLLDF